MKPVTVTKAALAASIALLSLSCAFLQKAATPSGATPGGAFVTETVSSNDIAPEDTSSPTDARVERLLALRSVQMQLETTYTGLAPVHTGVSVDTTGNQYIQTTLLTPENVAGTPESPDWNVAETYILEGTAYTRTGKNGSADPVPEESDALRQLLYNPDGPGMWLLLLPNEAFSLAGKEPKGGFDADKYLVNGTLDTGKVQGVIWVDGQTGALVGTDLSISASLLFPGETDSGGMVMISLVVEKADIPPISLP